jgi:cell division control protein 7
LFKLLFKRGHDHVIGINAVLRNKSHILLIMPYLDHIAFHENYLNFDVQEVKEYMRGLLKALNRVHKFNIIHRDIKPSNFLYDRSNKSYALVDFGLAQSYEKPMDDHLTGINTISRKATSSHSLMSSYKKPSQKSSSPIIAQNSPHTPSTTTTNSFQKFYSFHKTQSENRSACVCYGMSFVCDVCLTRNNKWAPRAGTAGFRAPEVLFRYVNQTPAVDIWSAGTIFLSLLSGRYPFFKVVDDNMAIMQLITLFGLESMKKIALKYSETLICSNDSQPQDLKQLCKSLRVGNKEIHFPDSAYDLLKGLLELDFEKRLTASEALEHEFFKN